MPDHCGPLHASLEIRYNGDEFSMLSGIAIMTSQFVLMKWMADLSAEEPVEHLCYESNKVSSNMYATVSDKYGKQHYVTVALLAFVVEKVKLECTCLVNSSACFSLHLLIPLLDFSQAWLFCTGSCFLSIVALARSFNCKVSGRVRLINRYLVTF